MINLKFLTILLILGYTLQLNQVLGIVEIAISMFLLGYPSESFNILYLESMQDNLLKNVINENISFMCFPTINLEESFENICNANGLILSDNVMAHKFANLSSWNYQPSNQVSITKINSDKQMLFFDQTSSECYQHPRGPVIYLKLESIGLLNNLCILPLDLFIFCSLGII